MKINVKSLVILLNRLDITVEQFLFLTLTYDRMHASLYAYIENNKGFSKEGIDDLVEKGYIVLANAKQRDKYLDSYETTEKYKKALYASDMYAASEEFWDAFPSFIVIDSKKIPAKSLDKDKFLKTYYEKIGKYPDLHVRVMEGLEYAKINSLICMGLEKWFISEQWEEALKEKENLKRKEFPSERIF